MKKQKNLSGEGEEAIPPVSPLETEESLDRSSQKETMDSEELSGEDFVVTDSKKERDPEFSTEEISLENEVVDDSPASPVENISAEPPSSLKEEIPEPEYFSEKTEPASEEKDEGKELVFEKNEIPAEDISADTDNTGELNDNSSFIRQQIDNLMRLRDEHNFTDFWFYVKELNKTIFTLRGIPKEDRIKFKDRIGELCNDTRILQEEQKTKITKTSHLKLERIQEIVQEALSYGMTHEELEKSFFKIEEANKFLREGKVQSPEGIESLEMSREHREQAKEIIKSGKDKIFDRKREIRDANFKIVTERLTAISDSLLSSGRAQKVFEGVKNLRNEMRSMNLDRAQLREIDNVIETLWKKAREKATTGRVHEAKNQISGLEDLARRKESFIKTLDKEIKDLNIKWSSVQNDFFKNRVNEWIEEKKEKMETTRKEIESTREKIKFLTEQMQRSNPT
ncbi:MAG: hypothetical protein ABIQ74_03475 [Chitinophagales bacterium]